MTTPRLVLLHVLSPLHCGTGHAIGGIDLPIAREKATKIPLVPGSSLKGVLRARGAEAESKSDESKHTAAFGPDTANAAEHAGALQFSDLRLTVLPVRSLRGTFAWLTSPYLLTRFARDAREAGIKLPQIPKAPVDDESALVAKGSIVVDATRLVLEEFDFAAAESDDVLALGAWFANALLSDSTEGEDRTRFAQRFAIIPDNVMAQLLDSSMEITTRVRLEAETKTVAKGALWTEEALPVESVLTGLLACTPVATRAPAGSAKELLAYAEKLTSAAVQIGGKASVGRGVCRLRLLGGS